MPPRARTEEGQNSDRVEHTGPNDGVVLGSVDADAGGSSTWIARPAPSRIRQMTPKQNGVSLLSTQVGTRGRSDSVPSPLKAFSNVSVRTGQIDFNITANFTTTP